MLAVLDDGRVPTPSLLNGPCQARKAAHSGPANTHVFYSYWSRSRIAFAASNAAS
jgi:hypothetical protein